MEYKDVDGPFDWTDYNRLTLFDLVDSGELVTFTKVSRVLNLPINESKNELLNFMDETTFAAEISLPFKHLVIIIWNIIYPLLDL